MESGPSRARRSQQPSGRQTHRLPAPRALLPEAPDVAPFQPHYSNPLVAAKLLNVPRNRDVVIVCKILAEHVSFDNPHDPYEGKVEFKLKIQK